MEYMEGQDREKILRRCIAYKAQHINSTAGARRLFKSLKHASQGSEGSEEVATQSRFLTEVTSLCSRVKGRVPSSYLGTPPGYIGTPPVPSPSYLGTPPGYIGTTPVPSPNYLGTPPEPAAQDDSDNNNNNDNGDNNNGDDDNHQGAAPADNATALRQPPIERGSAATIAHSAADCGLPQCGFFQRVPLKEDSEESLSYTEEDSEEEAEGSSEKTAGGIKEGSSAKGIQYGDV